MVANYYVWVAYVDQAYGGPEEGGWWYDVGVPVMRGEEDSPLDVVQYFDNKDDANEAREALRDLVRVANEERHNPGSVLSSGDWLEVQLTEHSPKAWPETRPHYE